MYNFGRFLTIGISILFVVLVGLMNLPDEPLSFVGALLFAVWVVFLVFQRPHPNHSSPFVGKIDFEFDEPTEEIEATLKKWDNMLKRLEQRLLMTDSPNEASYLRGVKKGLQQAYDDLDRVIRKQSRG